LKLVTTIPKTFVKKALNMMKRKGKKKILKIESIKKEDGNEPLKISSIFGSAKSSQEADNILILQDWEGKHIQVDFSTFYLKFLVFFT